VNEVAQRLKSAVATRGRRFLSAKGFEPDGDENLFHQFRRIRDDGARDLVEYQFDKHDRARCVLNFGRVPPKGLIDAYGRLVPVEHVRVSLLPVSARLHRWPLLPCWFDAESSLATGDTTQRIEYVMDAIERLFAEVELWFKTGERAAHVKVYRNAHNEAGVRRRSMELRHAWPPEGWTAEDEAATHAARQLGGDT
jgi:hypothetical protein